MNDFRESLKVERENSRGIIITESLKNLLIELMKGNISKKELMEKTDIGDKATVELKIKEIVAQNLQLKPLYNDYISRKSENFQGYNFRPEAIEMLRKDYSQTEMANKIGVSRRSFSTKMKELQEENKDNTLGILLKQHAERKMQRKKITYQEILDINLRLDEYEKQYPVGLSRYEKRSALEVRRENLQRVVSTVDELIQNGTIIKEISGRKIISESSYRKYKLELEALSKILEGKQEKEQ